MIAEPQLLILFKMLSGIQHIVNNFVLKHGKFNFLKESKIFSVVNTIETRVEHQIKYHRSTNF